MINTRNTEPYLRRTVTWRVAESLARPDRPAGVGCPRVYTTSFKNFNQHKPHLEPASGRIVLHVQVGLPSVERQRRGLVGASQDQLVVPVGLRFIDCHSCFSLFDELNGRLVTSESLPFGSASSSAVLSVMQPPSARYI